MTKNQKLRGLLAMVLVAALLLTAVPLWVGMWLHAEGEDTSPKVFTADFAELAALATQAGKLTGEVTEYATTSEDTALNDWINERFILRYGREHGTKMERPYLGASSHDFDPGPPVDTWGGVSRWVIKSDGYLKRTADIPGDQMLRKWDSLVVKGENGEAILMQNFETTFTVHQEFASRSTDNKAGRGAIVFGFRQDAVDIVDNSATAQRTMVVIGKGGDDWNTPTKPIGVSVLSDAEIASSGVYKNTAAEITGLDEVEEFRVTIRVVGTDCTVTITPPDGGTPYYTQQVTLPDTAAGYISYGVAGSTRSLGDITLTQLDGDGKAVDFGSAVQTYEKLQFSIRDLVPYGSGGYQPVGWGPTTWYPFYNEWIEIANTFRTYINTHFAMYNNLNGQCTVAEMKAGVDCFGAADKNVWLERHTLQSGISDTRTLGRITSMVYKDAASGDLAKFYNFETEFLFRLDATQGGIVLGFRQQTPGKFSDSETAVNKEQGFVAITTAGVTVAAGDAITDSMYDGVTTTFTENLSTGKQLVARIRVVNDKCTVTILDASAQTLFTQEYTVNFDKVGYLAYGVSAKKHAIADITLIHLDDDGEPMDIGAFTSKEDGTAVDPENSVVYDFSDETQLDDFHSYFVPIAFSGYDIIDSNANSEWALENGKLKLTKSEYYQADSVYRSKDGVDIAGSHYQCDWVYGWNANFGVLMLKKQPYKNFAMTVEFVTGDPFWPVVGFGAGGTDTSDVFCTQEDGGYAVLIEQSGRTKLWGWQASKKNSNDPHFNYLMDEYTNSNIHRLRLIVNEGVLYVYLDNYEEPIVHTLPSTYDGGYVYLATNSNALRFNHLTVTDLDNANIEVASAQFESDVITVDRAAGETLQLPACAQITDVKGYNYISPITWECEDYRSYKDSTFTFTGTVALTGTTIAKDADLSALSVRVQNNINGDYNEETSVKYYFDTVDDLRDFTTYANEKVSYDGALAVSQTSEHWTISDGKLLRKIDGASSTDPNYNDETLTKNVSSIILNARDGEQLTLMNFQLDVEYRLAQDSWLWPMIAIGVNDPEQFITKQTTSTRYEMQKNGGGMYIFTERESPIQARGAVYNADSERFIGSSIIDANGNLFSTSFDKTKTHHMRIRVYDGTAYISVDGSQEVVVNIDASAWGGYIGFVVQDASVTFDNLTVTALNSEGEVVPLSEVESGFSPKGQVDTYLGWNPTKEEWYYVWSSEYK